ncbi:MAG TPA: response regulator [Ktedonobacteraceae bacterium]|jgi:chemotaxis protein histidine kinase CheA
MDEISFSPTSEELSAEDLAIIQAFDAMDDLVVTGNLEEQASGALNNLQEQSALNIANPEDMLMLFASEADEDLGTMRRALNQLEQDNQTSSPGLVALGRTAHKLKGTAGAMGCESMSTIALKIEEEIQLIKDGKIAFFTGLMALVHAINALEVTLQSALNDGQESALPLQELMQDLSMLNVETEPSSDEGQENPLERIAPKEIAELSPVSTAAQVDTRVLHALMSHTEHLIELNAPLQSAQKQVTKSLMELQAAHARLRHLEGLLSSVVFPPTPVLEANRPSSGEHAASSLVARILHEAFQRTGRQPPRQASQFSSPGPLQATSEAALWDEMQMDRFTENRILLQSFSEAVADVATASAQLRAAFAQLNTLIEQQVRQATLVRNDALRLRSAPFSVLLNRVQHIVQILAQRYKRQIQFETAGETAEIDQDILEVLAEPLLQLIRTSVADSLLSVPLSPLQEGDRIRLQAQVIGNDIAIELSFSMPIPGGALEMLRGPVQRLHGSISARRNTSGGVSYQLRFPRAQGVIQGLLVQAGGQELVLPLPHIDVIDYNRQETHAQVYHLAALLGFPLSPVTPASTSAPVILLAGSHRRIAVQVDEIVGEIELIIKPLPEHLQRPGLAGAAVDGSGNVLLIVDLPLLIRYATAQPHYRPGVTGADAPLPEGEKARQPATILVADDSVYIRQSLRQTFERAGYQVIEARDGIEALELLSSDQPPALLLLDIEMPNLNGYDLLNIMHSQPGFTECKAILLTSRSSEKHRQRAMELGAYAFLSKPCPQEILLDAVYKALANLPAPV